MSFNQLDRMMSSAIPLQTLRTKTFKFVKTMKLEDLNADPELAPALTTSHMNLDYLYFKRVTYVDLLGLIHTAKVLAFQEKSVGICRRLP